MRRVLIGLALVLVATSASAQTTEKNIAKCGSENVNISISACTAMLQAKPATSAEWRLAAYYARGLNYSEKGLYDLAIADFTNAIALKPRPETLANLHGAIGLAYLHKQLYAECIVYTSRMIELQPNKDATGYRVRGYAYELSEQRDKAIADYRMALKFDPEAENLKAALIRLGVTP